MQYLFIISATLQVLSMILQYFEQGCIKYGIFSYISGTSKRLRIIGPPENNKSCHTWVELKC